MPPPLPALVGTAWLDGDADGIRGSAGNRTLNALEYNVGVGGVVATLVGCGDDADAGWSTTTVVRHLHLQLDDQSQIQEGFAGNK